MKLKSSCHNVVIVSVLLFMLPASTDFAASDAAEKKSWKQDTALVSPQGTQTIVCRLEGDKILFRNADPQLAIEWGMGGNAAQPEGVYLQDHSSNVQYRNIWIVRTDSK